MHESQVTESMISLAPLGFEVRVLTAGEGPPVLLLHGNPDSADEWREVMARLAGRFRCIAPDFPGYGRSPSPPASFAYDRAAQLAFVDATLAALEVTEPLVLVVHDIGGFVGTPWAAANLERVRGVVFTNTVAFEGFRWFKTARQWGDETPPGRRRAWLSMAIIGLFGGALFKKVFGGQSPQLSEAIVDRMTRQFALNPAAKDATLRQFRHATQPDFFEGFDAMNEALTAARPTRVVWGEGDVYIRDKYADRFGSAPVKRLPGVGHWVPIVAADEVAAAVEEVAALGA
ncbi:MAG: alpha/beta fold hydrolase [Alphaproteobacteria bacterium]|nr:alpha/beta fold hydrolase [Alphaproteobacteria bacterium]